MNNILYLQHWFFFTSSFFVLSIGVFYGYLRGRVYTLFFLFLIAFHVFYLLDYDYIFTVYRHEKIVFGQIIIFFSSLFLLIFTMLYDKAFLSAVVGLQSLKSDIIPLGILRRYFFMVFVIVSVCYLIRFRGETELALGGWEQARSSQGPLDVLSTLLAFVAFPSLAVALLLRRIAGLLLLPLLIGLFLIIGSRALALSAGGAVMIYLIAQRRIHARMLIALALVSVIVLATHTGLRLIRGLGLEQTWLLLSSGELLQQIASSNEEIDLTGGESEIYRAFYFSVDRYDTEKYQYSAPTLVRALMLFFPRSIFSSIKPEDITYDVWSERIMQGHENMKLIDILTTGDEYGSNHPLIWGDSYINVGLIGILLYPLFISFLLITMEYILNTLSPLAIYTIGGVIAIEYAMLARGSVIVSLGNIVYTGIISSVIFFLFRIPLFRKDAN